jgi:hypothetical protein
LAPWWENMGFSWKMIHGYRKYRMINTKDDDIQKLIKNEAIETDDRAFWPKWVGGGWRWSLFTKSPCARERKKYFFYKSFKNALTPLTPSPKGEPTPTLPKGGSAMRNDKEQGVHSFNRVHILFIGCLIGSWRLLTPPLPLPYMGGERHADGLKIGYTFIESGWSFF